MAVEVKVPSVGESVQEGIIYKWHKNDGEYVEMDDVIVELETDKATVEIVSEGSGVIKTQKKEGDTVTVGEVIAVLDDTAAKPAETAAAAPAPQAATEPATASAPPPPPVAKPAAASSPSVNDTLSPAVGRMVAEHDLDPNAIAASGRGGRVTKEDVVNHMKSSQSAPAGAAAPNLQVVNQPGSTGQRGVRREPMSMLRRRIAERMLQAQANAALLTTFNEIDMFEVMQIRKQYKESFKEKHGVGLGFMSFFVKATIAALKECPAINGWIEDNEIVYHDYYDVGVAVSSPRGLVVPVIRDCDKLSFAEIEGTISEKAQKARAGKLTVDEMQGGTFTITNGGVFGSLMSTPILNPPQSGILGMHTIKQRPMVIDGEIVARPMMYVALSYDHRIVDGSEAVTFLVKIKEAIEDPSRLLLGV